MKPVKVTGLDLAFGGDMSKLLPAWKDIPDEFKRHYGNKFVSIIENWFFSGLGANYGKLMPKEGIDKSEALAHIKAVLGSFEPKHEHKTAGCAYLLSQFFTLSE